MRASHRTDWRQPTDRVRRDGTLAYRQTRELDARERAWWSALEADERMFATTPEKIDPESRRRIAGDRAPRREGRRCCRVPGERVHGVVPTLPSVCRALRTHDDTSPLRRVESSRCTRHGRCSMGGMITHTTSPLSATLVLLTLALGGCVESTGPLTDANATDTGPAVRDTTDASTPSMPDAPDAAIEGDAGMDASAREDGCAPAGSYTIASVTPDPSNGAGCRGPSTSSAIEVDDGGIPTRTLCDDGCACDITPATAPSCTARLVYGCNTPLTNYEMVYDGDEVTLTITGELDAGEACRFVAIARRIRDRCSGMCRSGRRAVRQSSVSRMISTT